MSKTPTSKTLTFNLTDNEEKALNDFIERKKQEILDRQMSEMSPEDFERETFGGKSIAHMDCTGACLTYIITPTGLGPVIKVKFMDEEICDITDYENF